MAEVREQRRQDRAEARAGRRTDAGEPAGLLGGIDLKRAITTAAAAAVVGGLAGAAKAFADRQGGSGPTEQEQPDEPSDEPPKQVDEHDDQSDETQHEPEDERAEQPDAHEQEQQPDQEHEQEDEPEQRSEPAAAPSGDVARVIARAREHVEQVLGDEPEGVSGIERTNGNWCVSVEIVKLRRIPESTDVLATYAVVVDGDGDLVSLQELRRYRRSQSEDDR